MCKSDVAPNSGIELDWIGLVADVPGLSVKESWQSDHAMLIGVSACKHTHFEHYK